MYRVYTGENKGFICSCVLKDHKIHFFFGIISLGPTVVALGK